MIINILPIVSALHDGETINEETKSLISKIEELSEYRFKISNKDHLYETELSLVLVQSGGSEGRFLEMEKDLKPPYYLLTYGSNNSLAASMEILSYLKNKNEEAEILHGTAEYIVSRLNELNRKEETPPVRLGVVGKPSDWLIASDVDYEKCKSVLNIELVDVEMQELIETYNRIALGDYKKDLVLDFDPKEVDDAKKLSKALELLKEKYQLEGLTLRCFDLLDTVKTTGCLGLALLNSEDSIGTCEGDIPAMLSMHILKQATGSPGFQANPSRIDAEKNEMVFAHCTLPLNMTESFEVMTHYESGIGVAFRGHLKEQDITIFKLSNNLKDYYVSEGKITQNMDECNLCRTQIKIKVEDTKYFLSNPYGNHHIIVFGKHKNKLIEYMRNVS